MPDIVTSVHELIVPAGGGKPEERLSVELTVDRDQLVRVLGYRAHRNTTGHARIAWGFIRARIRPAKAAPNSP